jgi:hypothetical protein
MTLLKLTEFRLLQNHLLSEWFSTAPVSLILDLILGIGLALIILYLMFRHKNQEMFLVNFPPDASEELKQKVEKAFSEYQKTANPHLISPDRWARYQVKTEKVSIHGWDIPGFGFLPDRTIRFFFLRIFNELGYRYRYIRGWLHYWAIHLVYNPILIPLYNHVWINFYNFFFVCILNSILNSIEIFFVALVRTIRNRNR